MFKFNTLFGASSESYGDYRITIKNDIEVLMQDYGNCKEGYRSSKVMELPIRQLTAFQKKAWLDSVKNKTPINPLTLRRIEVDGPTAAMLMILSKRPCV